MATRFRTVVAYVLVLPSLLGLAAYGYLGSLSRFIADDYCVAYYARHFGLLRSIWYWYITWSGGYSTSIADWLLVLIRAEGMPFVVPTVLLVWLAAATAAVALLLPSNLAAPLRAATAAALGPLTVFSILLLSPDVPQSLYWWTGMRAYVVPLIISAVWVIIYRLFVRGVRPRSVALWSLLSFGIIFLNGGFSETFTPVQLVFFLTVLTLGLYSKRIRFRDPSFYFLSSALLGAFLSLVIMVSSPGNAQRQAFFPPPPGLFPLLAIAFRSYSAFLLHIVTTPEKVVGLLGAVLAAFWLASELQSKSPARIWLLVALFLGAFIFAFGCFIPGAWGFSDAPPDRNLSIAAFFLSVGLLGAGFTAGSSMPPASSLLGQRLRTALPILLSLFLLGFAAFATIRSANDSRQSYVDYAQKWDAVNRQIIAAQQAGQSVVHIPDMHGWAELDVPNDNPKYWLTICFSKYYDIQVFSP